MEAIDVAPDGQVLLLEPLGQQRVLLTEPDLGRAPAQRPQGVEDHGHVDDLLEDRTPDGREETDCSDTHGGQGKGHPCHHALDGDPPGASGNGRCLTETIQPVDGEHHIGGFGRGGGPSGPQSDPDVGQGECGRVVDAVTDHHGRSAARFELHDVELLGRGTLGQHLVDPDHRPDGLGHLGPVTGDHHDAVDPVLPQRAKGPGSVGSQGIIEDQDTGRYSVDAHEDGESTVEVRLATCRAGPGRCAGHS